MGIEALKKSFVGDKSVKTTKNVATAPNKTAGHENIRSSQFNFKVLTKEEVENNRCKAYNYAL